MYRKYIPEDECSRLAANIKLVCEARGLSIYAAAEKADMSKSALTDLLNGKTRPQLYTLYKICNALEISILELFKINERDGNETVKDEDLISRGEAESEHKGKSEKLALGQEDKIEELVSESEFMLTYRYMPEWKKKLAQEYMSMLVEYKGRKN